MKRLITLSILLIFGISYADTRSPDINGDGIVDSVDYGLFVVTFETTEGDSEYKPECDLNGDGIINIADLFIILDALGGGGVVVVE